MSAVARSVRVCRNPIRTGWESHVPTRLPGACTRIYRAVDRYGIVHLESEHALPVWEMVEREQAGWNVQHSDDRVSAVTARRPARPARSQLQFWEQPMDLR